MTKTTRWNESHSLCARAECTYSLGGFCFVDASWAPTHHSPLFLFLRNSFYTAKKMGKTLLASVWPSKQNSAPSPPPPSEFFLDGLWCLAIPLASLSGCAELPYPLHRPHGVIPPVPPPPRQHLMSFAVARRKINLMSPCQVLRNHEQNWENKC